MLVAAVVACGVGYLSLLLLIRIIRGGKFWYFSFYVFAAGAFSIIASLS
jgi:undecaprenyl pyrophosphate phosphatase UppP